MILTRTTHIIRHNIPFQHLRLSSTVAQLQLPANSNSQPPFQPVHSYSNPSITSSDSDGSSQYKASVQPFLNTLKPRRSPQNDRSSSSTRDSNRSTVDREEWDEMDRRDERRSPAAQLGSKRLGLAVLPEGLIRGIQREIDGNASIGSLPIAHNSALYIAVSPPATDPREVRQSFLSTFGPQKAQPKRPHESPLTPSLTLAKAAAVLPGEYAAVRNVFLELDKRLGEDWLSGGVVEVSGGLGAGAWAASDRGKVVDWTVVHASRHGKELGERVAELIPEGGPRITYPKLPPPDSSASSPSLAMSSFHLSSLPTPSARHVHLKQLLSLSSPYIILIDRSSKQGWEAISDARSFLLSQSSSENPLHVVAPCPHDGPCPLSSTRDICGYKQKLQRPAFLRRTKHSSKGEEAIGYCYVVIARGSRPTAEVSEGVRTAGRIGGVGKDEAERIRAKMEGKSVLHEVEGGEYEMVDLAETAPPSVAQSLVDVPSEEAVSEGLKSEAYSWPRLVAPPMKRSGHVVMDACCDNGQIQRLTFSKSHSKQGYYDARKSSWGDLFPHEPKGRISVRTRGVRKLNREEGELDGFGPTRIDFIPGWPVAELDQIPEAAGKEDDVTVWRSGKITTESTQRRGLHTGRPRVTPLEPSSIGRRFMSARPMEKNGSGSTRPKVTINALRSLASSKTPITCLTAYDYPTALLSESAGVDMVLIGDSLSQVVLGHEHTTSLTLDEVIHHSKAVTRGAKTPFVFADMPFGSFEASVEDGVRAVIRLIKEAGVDGVKIEGGLENIPLVKRLSEAGIAVIPHIGLQPQRATLLSGYLVQGRTPEGAKNIYDTALAFQEAGAIALLLEAIPHSLARYITSKVSIPTIGIGAGPGTSGQVLVITDVLGTYKEEEGVSKAKFVRYFGDVGRESKKAVEGYVREVKGGTYPEIGTESYTMKKENWEEFKKLVGDESTE